MDNIRVLFEDAELELRTAFYQLGNYLAAWRIAQDLTNNPVVLDRFWHSTCAFAVAQYVTNNPSEPLPDAGSVSLNWPEDLLKPDIVLLLHVSEAKRLERISNRQGVTKQENLLKDNTNFRQKYVFLSNVIVSRYFSNVFCVHRTNFYFSILSLYNRMRNPEIVVVNADLYPNKVMREVKSKIEHLL